MEGMTAAGLHSLGSRAGAGERASCQRHASIGYGRWRSVQSASAGAVEQRGGNRGGCWSDARLLVSV